MKCIILSLLTFSLLAGCGEIRKNFSRLSSDQTEVVLNANTSSARPGFEPQSVTLAGGLIVYAVREDGTRKAVSIPDQNQSLSMMLPNGDYFFYAVGWVNSGLESLSPPSTDLRCGMSQKVELRGIGQNINLSLDTASCQNQSVFAPADALFGSSLAPLKFSICQPDNNLAGMIPTGGCAIGQSPYIGSFRVTMLAYDLLGPGMGPPPQSGGISSACITGPIANSAQISTALVLPTGVSTFTNAPFAAKVDFYPQSETCGGSPSSVVFSNGLSRAPSSGDSRLIGNGSGVLNLAINTETIFTLNFTSGQNASVVIGQPNFTTSSYTSATSTSMSQPMGIHAAIAGKLFITSANNNRVLAYNTIPTANNTAADFVLGQTNFTSETQAVTASGLTLPSGVTSSTLKLGIADNASQRVVIFNILPSTTGASANVAVGAANLTTAGSVACNTSTLEPQNLSMGGNKLVVASYTNHRVLIFNTIPTTSGASANLYLGDASCAVGTTASTFSSPRGVWTNGKKLMVVDNGNNRILIWNTFPTSNAQAADLVLGQSNFTSSTQSSGPTGLNNPFDVWSNGKQVIVADRGNFRVLVWNSFPTTNGQAADVVLGQPNMYSGSPSTTQDGLNEPSGVTVYKNKLVVSDTFNNRAVVFQSN